MEKGVLTRNRLFITLALIYALLGGGVAVLWLLAPGTIPGDAVRLHAHLMLLGFVTMMIYGIGLHALPRFSGRNLFSERTADAQFLLANAGLPAMAAGWLAGSREILLAGGLLTWAAMLLFTLNILLTVRRRGPGEV